MSSENIPKTAGEAKVDEYVARIKAGEDKILEGLSGSFRQSILEKLGDNPAEANENKELPTPQVPPQYVGLSADVLEDIWTIPIYVDPAVNAEAQKRKKDVIDFLRAQEKALDKKEESERVRLEDIEDVRRRLNSSEVKASDEETADKFAKFKMKNGETAEGYFWYEYRNQIAKEMKQEGKFEWGKERIYFDIATKDMITLRDLTIKIASLHRIPIAFKFQDEEKTWASSKDGNETRFVANFASSDDALKFYDALRKDSEYQSLQSDRNMSYGGFRVDGVAEYANGYREQRDPLKRIMAGTLNGQGKWEYKGGDGRTISISTNDYDLFKKMYEEVSKKMSEVEEKWKTALGI